MTHFIILVAVVSGIVIYLMTGDERKWLFGVCLTGLRHVQKAITLQGLRPNPFSNALRERTPKVLATPALATVSAVVFVMMAFAPGSNTSADKLIHWGGNIAARTTDGEWWRLLTTIFVHSRLIDLFLNIACVIQLGVILERTVGPFAFTAVYVASGVAAAIVSLSAAPAAVTIGASPSIL